jgi:hypothetical protein
MYILTVDWDFRALWSVLTITARLYFVCLLVAAGYAVIVLIRALSHTKDLHKTSLPIGTARSIDNLRQLILLMFFVFGAVFANEIFATIRSIKLSTASLSALGIEAFEPCMGFAFVVFCVLAALHTCQWIASGRVRRATGLFVS